MPWSGTGVWSAPSLPGSFNPAIVGQQATPADWNTFLAALSGTSGLSNAICRDGQTTITANLPMAGFRHTGVGAATAITQYGVVGDIINTGYVYGADVGAADAYEITLSPAPAAYAVGQIFRTTIANANATSTPTFKVTGLDPGTIVGADGNGLAIGVLSVGRSVAVQVTAVVSTTPTFQLLSLAYSSAAQVLRSYLAGFGTSNNVSNLNTQIDVAAGECADATNTVMLSYSGGTLNCATTGANGLDTGTLASNTWYYLDVIGKTDGTTATLASASLASPTMPSGYTLKRRIAAFKTDSSAHILAYVQVDDRFLWKVPPIDQNPATVNATAALYTLTVPPGLKLPALVRLLGIGYASFAVYSPNQSTETVASQQPPANLVPLSAVAGNASAANYEIVTNTASQIAAVCYADGGQIYMATDGWIDRLGRNS